MKVLYVNSCVRTESRTNRIAKALIKKYEAAGAEIIEIRTGSEDIQPLSLERLQKRDCCIQNGDYSDGMFQYAKQLVEADVIVIAAPFWDMSFPASLKNYIENVMVTGLVFKYDDHGMPVSLCRASKMVYVSTAGGPVIPSNMGYDYVKLISEFFWGIRDNVLVQAQLLDVTGADTEAIVREKIAEIEAI